MNFLKKAYSIISKHKEVETVAEAKEVNDVVYSILNIKTTGTNKFIDEIISISIIKYKNEEIIDKYFSYIKAKTFVDRSITYATKIDNKKLQKHGRELIFVLSEVIGFIGDSFLISHNALDFEIPFLNQKLKKYNMKPISASILDTKKISKTIFCDKKLKHDLNSLSQRMKIVVNKPKDFTSEYNAEVLLEIWKQFLNYFGSRKMTIYDWAIKINY